MVGAKLNRRHTSWRTKKGADSEIDGTKYFFDDFSGKPKMIVIQAKGWHIPVSQIRGLKGVMEREKAEFGVFITLQVPTKPMKTEAAAAGFYEPQIVQEKTSIPGSK